MMGAVLGVARISVGRVEGKAEGRMRASEREKRKSRE